MLLIEDAAIRIAKVFGAATDKTSGMDLALKALEKGIGVIVTGIQALAIGAQGLAFMMERAERNTRKLRSALQSLTSGGLLSRLNTLSQFTPTGLASQLTRSVIGFQEGGTVPGAFGTPQLAIVHAGETVTPAGETAISLNTTINASGGLNEERINALFQEFVDGTLIPALS
jgi:hypothetical protein